MSLFLLLKERIDYKLFTDACILWNCSIIEEQENIFEVALTQISTLRMSFG